MTDYLWNALILRLGLDVFPVKSYSLNVEPGMPPTMTVTYCLTEDELCKAAEQSES